MPQKVRDIHGNFVTQEELDAQIAAIKAKFPWTKAETLYVPECRPDTRIVALTEPDDLLVFGKHMNHCSAGHVKWTKYEKIELFLTLLDKYDEPHSTVMLKKQEWFNRKHPGDTVVNYHYDYLNTPGTETSSIFSSSYDYQHIDNVLGRQPVLVHGDKYLVIVTQEPNGRGLATKNKPAFQEWYEKFKVEE